MRGGERKERTMFTVGDFKEIRPGVFKLDGHDVYVSSNKAKEVCGGCDGKGKCPGVSKSGRKTWSKCMRCHGKGNVTTLTNIESSISAEIGRAAMAAGKSVWRSATLTFDTSLESYIERLNEPGLEELENPIFVTLLH